MPDLALTRNWCSELADGLPDCRLRYTDREHDIVYHGRMPMERVYCADCGTASGMVTANWTAHVFFICNECVRKNGRPLGRVEIPENIVRGEHWPSMFTDQTEL